jgi:hypothetical protein
VNHEIWPYTMSSNSCDSSRGAQFPERNQRFCHSNRNWFTVSICKSILAEHKSRLYKARSEAGICLIKQASLNTGVLMEQGYQNLPIPELSQRVVLSQKSQHFRQPTLNNEIWLTLTTRRKKRKFTRNFTWSTSNKPRV